MKKSFKAKIILPTFLVLSVLVVILNIFLALRFSTLRDRLVDERLTASVNSLKLYLADSKESSRAAAVTMASNPAAAKAIKERDQKALFDLLIPTHSLYRVNSYTVCDTDGIVLARTYAPEHLGDSILNQQNVKDALEGKVETYFEPGTVVKVGVRTGAPVYDEDGALVGVVSASVMFNTDEVVDDLKELFRAEVTVFLGDTRVATTIMADGRRAIGTQIDPDIARIIFGGGREYSSDLELFGERYKGFYKPITNAHNEAFAAIFLGIPMTDLVAESNRSIQDGILLGLGGLVMSCVLLFHIISFVSKPIVKLSKDVQHIADGNLDVEINAEGEDEVGHLCKSLRRVTDTLHDLAEIGMHDPLTGIPNRRSFDNRLEMEWKHAFREKKPLSLLFIDVDKFKIYNDTYGHQQGDEALRTVAKSLRESPHRAADFAARWGGEEFVVLLPNTEEAGAMIVAENIRSTIESTAIPASDPKATNVTVSIGVHTRIPTPDCAIKDFISVADVALYKAKETGRNKAVLAAGIL
jgi:diguanylate cyclase (GGDEF)-like protein